MAKPVELTTEALADAAGAASWYAERNPAAAEAFAAELRACLTRVGSSPARYPEYLHGTRRALLGRFPFAVVYIDEPVRALVVAIAHLRRRPGYWR